MPQAKENIIENST